MSSSIALRPQLATLYLVVSCEDGSDYSRVIISRHISILTMPPWSMISPASRGIGFALARRVLQTTNAPVVATARMDLDKTKEELLEGLDIDESRLKVLKLDVTGRPHVSQSTIPPTG